MPTSALKPCSYPGCEQLVRTGCCEKHAGMRQAEENQRYHNDPQIKALYNSADWQSVRRRQLARSPWCADCLKAGLYVQAVDVDHIHPHRGDRAAFFRGPLQSLCRGCHSRKTAGEVFA